MVKKIRTEKRACTNQYIKKFKLINIIIALVDLKLLNHETIIVKEIIKTNFLLNAIPQTNITL